MSLLRGTIKSQFGFVRRFSDMCLKDLDFTSGETDYMLEELDGIDEEEFVPVQSSSVDISSKKRVRNEEVSKVPPEKESDNSVISKLTPSTVQVEPMDLEPVLAEQVPEEEKPKLPSLSSAVAVKYVDSDEEEKPKLPSLSSAVAVKYVSSDEEEVAAIPPCEYFEEETSIDAILEQCEYLYTEHRSLVVSSTEFISTPLHALKHIALKFDEPMHNEVMYIPLDGFKNPLVRVEIIVVVFRGVREAFHQRMATQMASMDCLLRLERLGSAGHLVPYALFPGWRLSPRIFDHLLKICKKNGLKVPKYVTKSNIEDRDKPVCKVECYIGGSLVGIGESDLAFVARKLSAYHAIEELTGQKFPFDFVALGSACTSINDLVKTGCVPQLSDAKKQWVLDPNGQVSVHSVADAQTLDALEQQVYQADLEEIKNEKKKLKISVQADKEDKTQSLSKRNISVN